MYPLLIRKQTPSTLTQYQAERIIMLAFQQRKILTRSFQNKIVKIVQCFHMYSGGGID